MKKDIRFSNYYYLIVFIGYALTLFLNFMRPGVFSALLMVLILLYISYIRIQDIKAEYNGKFNIKEYLKSLNLVDIVVAIYFIYNVFSVIWLTSYGYPVSVYANELVSSILPIVFYFVAIGAWENRNDHYRWFLRALLFIGLLSVILYALAPQFYCDYLFNWSYISKADASTARVRMESVIGSTSLSYLGVAGMCIASHFIFTKDQLENKKVNIIKACFMFFFSLILVFMANGRAGMVAAILVILFLNYIVVFKLKLLSRKIFYVEIAILVVGIGLMLLVTPSVVYKIWARLISLPGAVGQRSEQWIAAINNMKGAWLGNGLGANGHRALGIEGAHVVADGGLIKLFCEEGSVGFGLFTYIILTLFIKGYKKIDLVFAEMAIISTALLMSIGSNIIAFQLCTPIFWYAIGSISKVVCLEEHNL